MKFKTFYNNLKCNDIFEKIFIKYYNRGHWGKINKENIYEQQKDWFYKLKDVIKEGDYENLLAIVGNRDNHVTREYFSKLTRIHIKKKKLQFVKEKLHEYCLHTSNSPIRIGIVGFSNDDKFTREDTEPKIIRFFDQIDLTYPKRDKIIVSGLTNMGIPKIAYEQATRRKWKTVGISAEEALEYDNYPVDSKMIIGKKFGDESEAFINNIDILAKFGGGEQSMTEFEMAKSKGIKVFEFSV